MNELKSLPQNLEAEKAVLSTVLMHDDDLTELVDMLRPDEFYSDSHQKIWQAMLMLYRDGQKVDIVTLSAQLKKTFKEESPPITIVTDLFENTYYGSNIKNYVAEIKNKATLRRLIQTTQSYTFDAQIESADAKEILNRLEADIIDLSDKNIQLKPSDSDGIINELKTDQAKVKQLGWKGYNTEFKKLDALTGGLIPTMSWIVGAYTGGGKSFFILQVLLNVLRQGGSVALFSTEMDRKINMLRLIGNIAELGVVQMMRGNLLEHELEAMHEAEKELRSYKDQLTIFDNVYHLEEMYLKAKKLKITKGLNVVAVDFIQNMRGQSNIYERMAEAAIGLQQMGQELEVTNIIGSQVAQTSAGWKSKEAIEFKGAGEIAAIADVALWIQKAKEDPLERNMLLRKVRHGSPGKFRSRMQFPGGRYIDLDTELETESSFDGVQDQL